MKKRNRNRTGLALLFLFCAGAGLLTWAGLGRRQAAPVMAAPGEEKLVALTFDDGPKYSITASLLDGLEERGVKATFFLIGALAEDQPELVRRMAAEGHQIGLHSYDHLGPLTGLDRQGFEAQVGRSRELLRTILDQPERTFFLRPPYGSVDASVRQWCGGPMILWSIDPEDWDDRNVDREVEEVVAQARDGDIILMHDIFKESVEAALRIVDRLHQEGFYFVTVEELFAQKGIPLEAGQCYRSARS